MSPTYVALLEVWRGYYWDETHCIFLETGIMWKKNDNEKGNKVKMAAIITEIHFCIYCGHDYETTFWLMTDLEHTGYDNLVSRQTNM